MTDTRTRRRLSAEKLAVSNRNYRRARERALVKLSHLHPETYKELLIQERKSDEANGKAWIDIDGASNSVGSLHTKDATPTGESSSAKEIYDGGEA
jgi:hypothetical protein